MSKFANINPSLVDIKAIYCCNCKEIKMHTKSGGDELWYCPDCNCKRTYRAKEYICAKQPPEAEIDLTADICDGCDNDYDYQDMHDANACSAGHIDGSL
jgi:hypothetical protein